MPIIMDASLNQMTVGSEAQAIGKHQHPTKKQKNKSVLCYSLHYISINMDYGAKSSTSRIGNEGDTDGTIIITIKTLYFKQYFPKLQGL
jgi:hypothetical protein